MFGFVNCEAFFKFDRIGNGGVSVVSLLWPKKQKIQDFNLNCEGNIMGIHTYIYTVF